MVIVKRIASEEYTDEKALYEANKAVENLPQSDWNQNDETSADFIKNRPFYEKPDTEILITILEEDILIMSAPEAVSIPYEFLKPIALENGKTYTVTFEDKIHGSESETHDIICENGVLVFTYNADSVFNYTFTISSNEITSTGGEVGGNLKIETTGVSTTVKQLDEKFIPDTIARVSDISSPLPEVTADNNGDVLTVVEGEWGVSTIEVPVTSVNGQIGNVVIEIPEQVQPDWNQSDETATDYVKNRTHYEKNEMTTRTYSFEYDNRNNYEYKTINLYIYYKISDDVCLRIADATFSADYNGTEYSKAIPTCADAAKFRVANLQNGSTSIGRCYIIYEDGTKISNISLTKGIWFVTYSSYMANAKTTYAHVIANYSETIIKPLDEKFIPDTIARKEYVNEAKQYILLSDCENGYEYIVRMNNGVMTPVCRCSEISIDTAPNKTEYVEGESLDLTGLVVMATRQDGSTFVVTNYDSPTELPSDGIVYISYTEAGVTYTTSFNITISPVDSGDEDELPE